MKILGLDPATVTGFAWSDGATRKHGVWNLGQHRTQGQRLSLLASYVRSMGPLDMIAIEAASYGAGGRLGEGGAQWTTICWHNKLRGVIEMVAAELGARVESFHPSTIKAFATGSGRAKKPQMMRACQTHFGIVPVDDNEADAIFICELAKRPDCWPEPKSRKGSAGRKPHIKSTKKFQKRIF